MKKDRKKKQYYRKVVGLIVITIFATYLLFAGVFILFESLQYLTIGTSLEMSPFLLFSFFMLGSLLLGVVLAFISAKVFIRPINELSDATKKVAKGDFSVNIESSETESEIGELIKNFNNMVNDLKKIDTLKNDFIISVSHEFKTPLATIQGYSTLLQDETLSNEEREIYTRNIIEATKQLSSLTTNILKLSKLEISDGEIEKKRFDVAEQIRQAILLLESQWVAKNIDLDIDLAPAEIYANEELIMQVWTNVIGNAVKFSDGCGRVEIYSKNEGGKYVVTVKDYGCGMDEETQRRVFEKFYQGDSSHRKEGNGLGMALVKKILELNGGSIQLKSAINKGTTFTITLPAPKMFEIAKIHNSSK